MTDARSLARHVRRSFEQGTDIQSSAADAKIWLLAIHELIKWNALAEADFAARSLAASFPNSQYIRNLSILLARMPPPAADQSFCSNMSRWDRSLQIARRTGARATLLAFGDRHGSFGMPLPIAHRWFGTLQMHVIYLRDDSDNFFVDGIPKLAGNRMESIRILNNIIEGLGTSCTFCYGNSSGATAALRYGIGVQASAVLGLNATIPTLEQTFDGKRDNCRVISFAREIPAVYADAVQRPAVHLVYGASNKDDLVSAQSMISIPGVTGQEVTGSSGHDAHITLIEREQFGPLLHAFFGKYTSG